MATVYLSPSGNDSNTYAQAQNPATPWATPGKVQTSAANGDTVIMAAGTYTFASITFTKNFTFQAASGAAVILDAGGADVTWRIGSATVTSFSVTGLTFQNAAVSNMMFDFTYAASSVFTATNCKFLNNTLKADYKALFSNTDNPTTMTLNFTNCLFSGNVCNASYVHTGLFGEVAVSATYNLTGCTIDIPASANPLQKIFLKQNVLNLTVKNTIIRNSSGATVTWSSGTLTSTTVSYSDFYLVTSSPSGTGIITSDPLFCDIANSNFNLRPTSPCLDTGSL